MTMSPPSLRLTPLGTADLPALQALHVRCAEFIRETTGVPPSADEAESLLQTLPPGKTLADKLVLGISRGEPDAELVGVVELIRGYPASGDWYIGLLMIAPAARGAGIGTDVVDDVARRIRAGGGTAAHLVVREDNPRAIAFWRRRGFEETDRRIQDLGTKRNVVLKMLRRL